MTKRLSHTTELEQRDYQLATTAMTIELQLAVETLPLPIQEAIRSELCKILLDGNKRAYTITLITSDGQRQLPAKYHNNLPSWTLAIVTKPLTASEHPKVLAMQIMIGPEETSPTHDTPRIIKYKPSECPIDAFRRFCRTILGPNMWFS